MSKYRSGTKDFKSFNYKRSFKLQSKICGILNLGNNCYLNSGLQILASCEELVNELYKYQNSNNNKIIRLLNVAFNDLLNKGIYDPEELIDCFCKINYDFMKGSQSCSQNFIRTLIRNINDYIIKNVNVNIQYKPSNNEEKKQYNKYIRSNKIYPESKAQSIFSGMTKSHSKGVCHNCGKEIDNCSFSYFIDQNMYLDDFNFECKFSDILKANIGNDSILTMDCPRCKEEIEINEKTKIIKLPNILIFTLERYQGPTNKVKIKPDKELNMKEYIDEFLEVDSTLYELFAINIRLGSTANFGHEICQVKRDGKWYEINDRYWKEIEDISYFDSSYGLFYKKINRNKDKYNIKSVNKQYDNETYEINDNKLSEQSNIYNYDDKGKKQEYKSNNITNSNNINIIKNIDNNEDYETFGIQNIDLCKEVIINNIKNESNLNEFIENLNKNYSYIKRSNCSQKIILALINELKNLGQKIIKENQFYKTDEYLKYAKDKKIYPQTKAYSLYSISTRHYSYGKCYNCKYKFDYNTFDNNVDIFLYLPNRKEAKFSDILKENIGNSIQKKMACIKCNTENKFKEITKIIILPEILIFSLDRNGNNNKIKINIEHKVKMKDYIDYKCEDKRTNYKLFAINILKNNDSKIGYTCQVIRNKQWYEIQDYDNVKEISEPIYSDCSYGLFYKKC